jgi:hypothetical protein
MGADQSTYEEGSERASVIDKLILSGQIDKFLRQCDDNTGLGNAIAKAFYIDYARSEEFVLECTKPYVIDRLKEAGNTDMIEWLKDPKGNLRSMFLPPMSLESNTDE